MEIKRTTQFKRDFKKIRNNQDLVSAFVAALNFLVAGKQLPAKYKEHQLTGNLQGFTDIHLKSDLLLFIISRLKMACCTYRVLVHIQNFLDSCSPHFINYSSSFHQSRYNKYQNHLSLRPGLMKTITSRFRTLVR